MRGQLVAVALCALAVTAASCGDSAPSDRQRAQRLCRTAGTGLPARLLSVKVSTVQAAQAEWRRTHGLVNPDLSGSDSDLVALCNFRAIGAARGTPPRRIEGTLAVLNNGASTWVAGQSIP